MREKERAKSGFYFSDMAICFCFIKLENYNERERERSFFKHIGLAVVNIEGKNCTCRSAYHLLPLV
jgi:hypothetical protein